MHIEVGQKWKTRDGRTATVLEHVAGSPYPFIASIGPDYRYSVTQEGCESVFSDRESDLVELIVPKPDLIAQVVATLESTLPSAPDLLDKAAGHMRERAATYDSPGGERSMAKTVAVFNTVTGHSISEADGWLFMAALKQVRLFSNREKAHQDSVEDLVAYSALLGECCMSGGLK